MVSRSSISESAQVLVALLVLLGFAAGVLLGAYLMRCARSRHLAAGSLSLQPSLQAALQRHELAGFVGGAVVQFAPALLPKVVYQTDKTIVFHHPRPKHRLHLMFVPRKDIKNIGELSEADQTHLVDMFEAVVTMVQRYHLVNYRLWTNGPGKQDVAYLHFHLGAD